MSFVFFLFSYSFFFSLGSGRGRAWQGGMEVLHGEVIIVLHRWNWDWDHMKIGVYVRRAE